MRPDPDTVSPRMMPREHGAWAQLATALFVALLAGPPSVSGIAFALGAMLAFVAHEPRLVLLGHRGGRASRAHSPVARKHLALRAGGALAFALLGLATATPATRTAALLALLGPLAMVPIVWRRAERSAAGELVAGAALAGAALPSTLAAAVSWSRALAAWAVWAAGFSLATFAVRGVIRRARAAGDRREALLAAVAAPLVLCAAGGLWASGEVPWATALAVAPFAVMALALEAAPPPPRQLKRVGWALVGASLSAGALLVAGMRG